MSATSLTISGRDGQSVRAAIERLCKDCTPAQDAEQLRKASGIADENWQTVGEFAAKWTVRQPTQAELDEIEKAKAKGGRGRRGAGAAKKEARPSSGKADHAAEADTKEKTADKPKESKKEKAAKLEPIAELTVFGWKLDAPSFSAIVALLPRCKGLASLKYVVAHFQLSPTRLLQFLERGAHAGNAAAAC